MQEEVLATPLVVPYQKLLSESEERTLFTEWQKAKPGSQKEKLFVKILKAFSPIVWSCARRFAGYGIDQKELISEGMVAMVEAAQRFDLSRNYKFGTYCRTWVEGLMLAFIAKNYFPVSVCSSQRMKRLFFSLRREMNRAQQANNDFEPTREFYEMIAVKMDVSVDDVMTMIALFASPKLSTNVAIVSGSEDGEAPSFQDMLESPDEDAETARMRDSIDVFQKKIVNEAINACLNDREKEVFLSQLVDQDHSTLQELADYYGLSKERIRQVREIAFDKVRTYVLQRFGKYRQDLFMDRTEAVS